MSVITVRLDDKDKNDLEEMCAEMGMSMATFFTIYAKRALRERRIPFEINAPIDPFDSESNMKAIAEADKRVKSGEYVTKTMEELERFADA